MELIDRSVSLDFEKKRISCSLPLKGEEREFLSSNYGQATKILEQQVREYRSQEVTKEMIVKEFNKLLDNDHAAYTWRIFLLKSWPSLHRKRFSRRGRPSAKDLLYIGGPLGSGASRAVHGAASIIIYA